MHIEKSEVTMLDLVDAANAEAPPPAGGGLRFFVNPDDNDSAPVIRVNWCLLPAAAAHLKDLGVTDPKILVIILDPFGRERRLAYSLFYGNGEAVIQLKMPGEHHIHAALIQGETEWYLEKRAGAYEDSIWANKYTFESQNYPNGRRPWKEWKTSSPYLNLDAKVVVEVDENHFGSPPHPWVKWWADLFYDQPSRDACQLRRRLMFDWPWKIPRAIGQPVILGFLTTIVAIIWFLIVGISGFVNSILLARRGVRWWTVILRSDDLDPVHSWRHAGPIGSIFSQNIRRENVATYAIGLAFIPLPYVLIGTVYLFSEKVTKSVGMPTIAVGAKTAFGIAAGYIAICIWLTIYTERVKPWLKARRKRKQFPRVPTVEEIRKQRLRIKAEREREIEKAAGAMARLVCDGSGATVKPQFSITNPTPTVVRIYNRAKVALCKPYF